MYPTTISHPFHNPSFTTIPTPIHTRIDISLYIPFTLIYSYHLSPHSIILFHHRYIFMPIGTPFTANIPQHTFFHSQFLTHITYYFIHNFIFITIKLPFTINNSQITSHTTMVFIHTSSFMSIILTFTLFDT